MLKDRQFNRDNYNKNNKKIHSYSYRKFFNYDENTEIILSYLKEAEGEAVTEQTVQQDWSVIWNCFDDPHQLLTTPGNLPKSMQEMVRNAVSEMRRYYSRKVVDVLIKVTKVSLDAIRKRFIRELDSGNSLNKIFIKIFVLANIYSLNKTKN